MSCSTTCARVHYGGSHDISAEAVVLFRKRDKSPDSSPESTAKRLRKVRIESSSESDGVRESDAGTFSDSEVEEDINYCEDVNDAALPGIQNAPSSTETQTYESTAARTAEPTP